MLVNFLYKNQVVNILGLPLWLSRKNPPGNAGDIGLIPGPGRSPGEENGNPLQYFCLENLIDRGAWRVTVHGATKESNMTQCLNRHRHYILSTIFPCWRKEEIQGSLFFQVARGTLNQKKCWILYSLEKKRTSCYITLMCFSDFKLYLNF